MRDILDTIESEDIILKIDVEGYECKVSCLICTVSLRSLSRLFSQK